MSQAYLLDLGHYEISTDRGRIDIDRVEAFLRRSYWASERPRDEIERSLENSLCFGAYRKPHGLMVGFCRVVTDYVSFGWVADVFVDEGLRGAGVGKGLIQAVVSHPELAGLQLVLTTRDAHGLYEQFGFRVLPKPKRWMIRNDESAAFTE